MGAPLYDITIYSRGLALQDTVHYQAFKLVCNYIADFYHDSLNGYKPPKTGRICIHLASTEIWDEPNYSGSICSYSGIINEQYYLNLAGTDRYKYILDILHSTVSKISGFYNWEQSIFDNAYNHITENDFKFEKFYPEKKSPSRKSTGQLVLTKTKEKCVLSALITTEGLTHKEILGEKENWFWYDNLYRLAKNGKWFDNSSFGIYKGEKNCYFCTDNNEVVNDISFEQVTL